MYDGTFQDVAPYIWAVKFQSAYISVKSDQDWQSPKSKDINHPAHMRRLILMYVSEDIFRSRGSSWKLYKKNITETP